MLDVICKPTMTNKTAEIIADIAAYGNRVRTTSLISASWVTAEEIVVSEIGARLSPKIAPLMIAPHISPMSILRPAASGKNTGATAAIEWSYVKFEYKLN